VIGRSGSSLKALHLWRYIDLICFLFLFNFYFFPSESFFVCVCVCVGGGGGGGGGGWFVVDLEMLCDYRTRGRRCIP
jgi:hypothetical protein